jgi:hypothetical protein
VSNWPGRTSSVRSFLENKHPKTNASLRARITYSLKIEYNFYELFKNSIPFKFKKYYILEIEL